MQLIVKYTCPKCGAEGCFGLAAAGMASFGNCSACGREVGVAVFDPKRYNLCKKCDKSEGCDMKYSPDRMCANCYFLKCCYDLDASRDKRDVPNDCRYWRERE